LKSRTKPNPREQWVRSPKAFSPIIEMDIFMRAQAIIADRIRRFTSEFMLEQLRETINDYGFLRPALLSIDKRNPSPATYATRFGSLDMAYQRVFSNSLAKAHDAVLLKITERAKLVEQYDNFVVINHSFTLRIQPSMPLQRGYSQYWFFRPDLRTTIDITLGVPISPEPPHEILGYFIFPRVLMANRGIRLFASSECYLEAFGSQDLAFMEQLIE
jgi:hypothetical protein